MPGGELLLIDESYNANPASVRAALALLARRSPAKGGRRIAVLGDMLELGETGRSFTPDFPKPLDGPSVDVLYAAGPLMANLVGGTPAHRRGAHAAHFRASATHCWPG
jgi:UDP-N-acetylmuramoyl-tripeptide--D-alanyl-D-alanine ligase